MNICYSYKASHNIASLGDKGSHTVPYGIKERNFEKNEEEERPLLQQVRAEVR